MNTKALLCVSLLGGLAEAQVRFTDVTAQAGIRFTHNSGRAGKKWLPETMGSGCAWIDFDGDGWPDLFLVNSKDWTPKGRKNLPALYKNNRNGTFSNVITGSGLDIELMHRERSGAFASGNPGEMRNAL